MRGSWSLLSIGLLAGCLSAHAPNDAPNPVELGDDAAAPPDAPDGDEDRDAATEPDQPETCGEDVDALGPSECNAALEDIYRSFKARCASCHEDWLNQSGLDAALLVSTGLVVPDDPENSPFFQSIVSCAMPPPGEPRLTSREVASFRGWIACGAVDWN
jgi:hypothetical protein